MCSFPLNIKHRQTLNFLANLLCAFDDAESKLQVLQRSLHSKVVHLSSCYVGFTVNFVTLNQRERLQVLYANQILQIGK